MHFCVQQKKVQNEQNLNRRSIDEQNLSTSKSSLNIGLRFFSAKKRLKSISPLKRRPRKNAKVK